MNTVENRSGAPERDAETVRLLQARRPEGLRLLLESCAPKVRWILRREFGATLNEMEVDEVINLAAHQAWRAAESFELGKGTIRSWFYTISRNCAIKVIRREIRQRRHKEVEDWDGTALKIVQIDPVRPSVAHQKFIDDLRLCIDRLTPLQMSIIKADLSSGDIANAGELAKEHKTTKNSIYASRSLARKALKRELIRLGHSLGDSPSPSEE